MTEAAMEIWTGEYSSFADAPRTGPGKRGGVWLEKAEKRARDLLAAAARGDFVHGAHGGEPSGLSVLIASVGSIGDTVRVLDFGGALGFGYVPAAASLAGEIGVEYHIVELEETCEKGREIFKGNEGVRFHSEFESLPQEFDIVYAASTLQYIDDWKGALARLADIGAERLYLENLAAGDMESFVTTQNYYGSRIPYRFLNVREVISELENREYRLILKSPYFGKILGQYGRLPMDNFAQHRRLPYACSLLFRKRG